MNSGQALARKVIWKHGLNRATLVRQRRRNALLDLEHLDTDRTECRWPSCVGGVARSTAVQLQRGDEGAARQPAVLAFRRLEARAEEAALAVETAAARELLVKNVDYGAVNSLQEVVRAQCSAAARVAKLEVPAARNHPALQFWTGDGAAGDGNILTMAKGSVAEHGGRRQSHAFFKRELHLGKLLLGRHRAEFRLSLLGSKGVRQQGTQEDECDRFVHVIAIRQVIESYVRGRDLRLDTMSK